MHWFLGFSSVFRWAIDEESAWLIPDGNNEASFSNTTDLGYVATLHQLFLWKDKLLVLNIIRSKKQAVTTPKRKRQRLFSLDNFVYIRLKRPHLHQLS